jgi:uncharacterized membrane protein SirB2
MIQQFCDWLAATAVSQQFANMAWFVPTVQTLHILSIAVVVTSLGMLDFRLLRLIRGGPSLESLAGSFIPWIWRALGVLLASGILLIITEPTRELMNDAFRLKMLMVLALVGLTFVFQTANTREAGYWSASPARRRRGAALGVASLVLCVSIVAAGLLIAYV